jgi:PAS domain S-box-containing protein
VREDIWRSIFENSGVGIAQNDPRGYFVLTNRAYQKMVGYTATELQTLSWVDITYEEDRRANYELGAELWAGKLPLFQIEKRYRRKDGNLIWVRNTVSLGPGIGAVPQCAIAIVEDITERKRAEEVLQRGYLELERGVVERSVQLTAANEELRKEIIERERTEALLRAANQQIDLILDSITDRFFALDKRWRITAFNKHAEEQLRELGKDPASFIGTVLWDEFPNPPDEQVLRRAMTERVAITHEYYYSPLGEWVENRIFPSADGGLSIFQRYVSERKRAEEQLRRSEAYLAEGQKLSHTGSGSWNVSTGEVLWSEETYRIYGFEPRIAKPSYETFFQLVHPQDRLFVERTFEKVAHEKGDYDLDFKIIRPDGAIRYIHSVGRPLFNSSGDLIEVVGTVMDITEQKRAEEERKQLFRRIAKAQEDEQRRIALELHDQLGQQLSALTMKLTMLKAEHYEESKLYEQLSSLEAIAKQLDLDISFLVWELRPTALDDFGLLVALTNYVRNWSAHFGIRAELHASGMGKDRLNSEIDTVLYRVGQEALNNVAKHARAEKVDILIQRSAHQVSMIVEDDGLGFDTEKAFDEGQTGVGLSGMRERVALVGGTIDIESYPGSGTTVVVRIPAPDVTNGAPDE